MKARYVFSAGLLALAVAAHGLYSSGSPSSDAGVEESADTTAASAAPVSAANGSSHAGMAPAIVAPIGVAPVNDASTDLRILQASSTASRISKCLRANLCGQGPSGGYFDKHHTPENEVLNESLSFLKKARDASGRSLGYPSQDELFANFRIQNPETQILSLELLLPSGAGSVPLSESLARQIFSTAPLVTNDAKPLYFEAMNAATLGSPALHEEFVETLTQSLHNDDINTVADTVGKMNSIPLNESEFRQVVSGLCHIKTDPALSHNWNEIDSDLVAYHETHAFNDSDPNQICGG